ncbi:MAG: tryptophan synthase subunit alpha [Armatimonadetes bacterium]|nr:tryptophan synthase subunit alpha [Armatimonadota bacterium]
MRLRHHFEELRRSGDGGLIVFITGGDPTIEVTIKVVLELAYAGVDAIEIGIPFSDPLADGPVIQASSERALCSGTTIQALLSAVSEIREHTDIPLIFMSYFNPVLQYGLERFAMDCHDVGIDGVLITDLPPEEASEWIESARRHSIDTVFLLAPTSTDERVKMVAQVSDGFIYCVSRTGITGEREKLPEDLGELVKRIRHFTDKPIAVGFGVSSPEHVRSILTQTEADAVVVGSAVVRRMHEWLSSNSDAYVWSSLRQFASSLKEATLRVKPKAGEG